MEKNKNSKTHNLLFYMDDYKTARQLAEYGAAYLLDEGLPPEVVEKNIPNTYRAHAGELEKAIELIPQRERQHLDNLKERFGDCREVFQKHYRVDANIIDKILKHCYSKN